MICPNCGTPNKEGSKFCVGCGNRLENVGVSKEEPTSNNIQTVPNNIQNNEVKDKPKKKNKGGYLILIIILIILLPLLLFKFNKKDDNEPIKNNNTNNTNNSVKDNISTENSNFVTTFDNYNIEINMDIDVGGVTSRSVSKGIIDEKHKKEYLDTTTTTMEFVTLNNKSYYDFVTGWSYITQPYGGDVWWKEKSAYQSVDLGAILNKLMNMKDVTKISDDHYKVKMDKNDIKGLMVSGHADVSLLKGIVYVDVYLENGYIKRLEYDFSKILKGFTKFEATIEFSNYDNAGDVNIPQSIIDNAKEQ